MSTKPFEVVRIAGQSKLFVESDRIDDCLKFFQDSNIDCLAIIPIRGYKLKDIEFLVNYPLIRTLEIVFPPGLSFDLTPLYSLLRLQKLTISGVAPIALKSFPELKEFNGCWHEELHISECNKLEILRITGYKSKTHDLVDFPYVTNLRELCLIQTNFTSLKGILRLPTLKQLEIAYLNKLESLHDSEQLPHLEVFICQNCRKLKQHDIVRSLKRLRILRFNDCGDIPTLSFINELPDLEEFRFVNTNIKDGDLTPLLRLKRIGFLAKRHYSHTPEQIDLIIGSKE